MLDQSAKADLTRDRERLTVKGNELHYVGFKWISPLSCLAEIVLLFQIPPRLVDCSIHTADIVGQVRNAVLQCSATFYMALLRHVPTLYRYAL